MMKMVIFETFFDIQKPMHMFSKNNQKIFFFKFENKKILFYLFKKIYFENTSILLRRMKNRTNQVFVYRKKVHK